MMKKVVSIVCIGLFLLACANTKKQNLLIPDMPLGYPILVKIEQDSIQYTTGDVLRLDVLYQNTMDLARFQEPFVTLYPVYLDTASLEPLDTTITFFHLIADSFPFYVLPPTEKKIITSQFMLKEGSRPPGESGWYRVLFPVPVRSKIELSSGSKSYFLSADSLFIQTVQ